MQYITTDEQAGFRKERSCFDQIASLRIIVEQTLEWNTGLYLVFVDFEKAFDSLDRELLWMVLLFLVYINDAPNYLCCNSTIALFADDAKLHREIDHPGGENLLQNDLECLLKWSQDWSMESYKTKGKVLHIFRRKALFTNRYYTLDGQQLERVSAIIDTGMTVSNDMHMS